MAYRTQGPVGYPASPCRYTGSRSAVGVASLPLRQTDERFRPFIGVARSTVTRPSAS
jgi:hypothetical protein